MSDRTHGEVAQLKGHMRHLYSALNDVVRAAMWIQEGYPGYLASIFTAEDRTTVLRCRTKAQEEMQRLAELPTPGVIWEDPPEPEEPPEGPGP